ncbi:glycosyltransferase family 2 protein [Microbacterium yannicii]|uniref:glycosyltransferase family 2 protein n=1 Tax=Microbacterium yannicii TaxID=671622 RepID=UPI00030878E1|nr:glycosyltransferase family 2 protein [Microbacterium yannicii]
MRYDVVIATRNRADSLARCIDCIESQTVLPERVIIVDASDEAEQVAAIALLDRTAAVEWIWIDSAVRSLPHQRNLGLARVVSEVVLMPDDDSLLFPEAAAELLAAYALDEDDRLGGVSATGVATSPLEGDTTQISRGSRWLARLLPLRNRVERIVVPRPFEMHPRSLWKRRPLPSWVDGHTYAPVETIGGYLLSLRADLAREAQFDEALGYGVGYALHEDMEMSLRLQNDGYLLVAAHRAHTFHDVHPGKRAKGFAYGFCWIANYVYASARTIPRDTRAWRRLPRFLRYKMLLYRLRAGVRRDAYSREVSRGAQVAWAHRSELIDALPGDLSTAYERLCDRWLET